jgi:hypothetical protein
MEDTDISNCDTLVDEVEINLNILCALMLDGVGEVDRAVVAIVNEGNP